MPESELDEDSVQRAERLSSRLLDDSRIVFEQGAPEMGAKFFSEQRYFEDAAGVPIGDVLAGVNEMAGEFALVRRWETQMPFLELAEDEWAPISLVEFLGGPMGSAYGSPDWFYGF